MAERAYALAETAQPTGVVGGNLSIYVGTNVSRDSILQMKNLLAPLSNVALVLPLGFLGALQSHGQISEYEECSDGVDVAALEENLTAEERIAIMDAQFEAEIADTERCEVASSGGGGAGGGGGASGGGASGGGADAGASTSNAQESPNSLQDGERSIAVSSELDPASANPEENGGIQVSNGVGNNGRDHEALAEADNKKALAESILKRAEAEDDPVVKAALMKRYEELSK